MMFQQALGGHDVVVQETATLTTSDTLSLYIERSFCSLKRYILPRIHYLVHTPNRKTQMLHPNQGGNYTIQNWGIRTTWSLRESFVSWRNGLPNTHS